MFAIVSFLLKAMAVGVVKRSLNRKVPGKGQETLMVGMINYNSRIEQLLQFLLSCLSSHLHPTCQVYLCQLKTMYLQKIKFKGFLVRKKNPRVYNIITWVDDADIAKQYGEKWMAVEQGGMGRKEGTKEGKLPKGHPVPGSKPGFCLSFISFQYFPFSC